MKIVYVLISLFKFLNSSSNNLNFSFKHKTRYFTTNYTSYPTSLVRKIGVFTVEFRLERSEENSCNFNKIKNRTKTDTG